jgi:DNA-binding protein YbaB
VKGFGNMMKEAQKLQQQMAALQEEVGMAVRPAGQGRRAVGLLGRREGISAMAVVSLEVPQ